MPPRVVVTAAGLVSLLVGCGGSHAATAVRLSSSAVATTALTVPPDATVIWADVQLLATGGAPVVLASIAPDRVDAGVDVEAVRVRVLTADGDAAGNPNPTPTGVGAMPGTAVPVAGVSIPAYDPATSRPLAEVIVSVRTHEAGRYVISGLRVEHREGNGARSGRLAHRLVLCVVGREDLRTAPACR